ncbi:ParB/RepB/Spo0J family partition protein [Candidatus Bathyarchaeota archaeon]|nr:ParB/RepB/Spo0J family partition protein [Candidatus Bathyarchaeota archaeon]
MKIEEIPVSELRISEFNIRNTVEFGDDVDNEFVNNIETQGLLQPLVVRKKDNFYEILIGMRRFLSLKQKGASHITCIIKDFNDEEAIDASISENVFRKNVDPVTLGKWIKKRLEVGDITLNEYSKMIGKSKSTLSEWLRMNDLTNDIQLEVQEGRIPFIYALKIARMGLTSNEEKILATISSEEGFNAFKKAVDKLSNDHEKRGSPKGLKIVRVNFGSESSEHEKLKTLASTKGLSVSKYCLEVLREHVRSSNI